MNYALIFVGAILSFLSYKWSLYYMCNPNYYRLKSRSGIAQLWFETVSNVIFFSGYGLIIFSSGFRLSKIGINVGIVLLLHLVVFPILGPKPKSEKKDDSNQPDAGDD